MRDGATSSRTAARLLSLYLLTLPGCASPGAPCEECPTETARRTTGPPSWARSAASTRPTGSGPPQTSARSATPPITPQDETQEDLYCRKNPALKFGAWEATPADIRKALDRVEFVCAPTDWLAEAVSNCMQRMGQTAVTVRYGVFGGDRATPNACDVSVQTAEWRGRKWVTLACDIREDHTFFGYVTALEWTPKGVVTATRGCARDESGAVVGAFPYLEPRGWASFPEELKARLCH